MQLNELEPVFLLGAKAAQAQWKTRGTQLFSELLTGDIQSGWGNIVIRIYIWISRLSFEILDSN